MSLIQQALKRKLDEEQGRATPPPPPLSSAPLAGTPPATAPRRSLEVLPAMQPPPRPAVPESADGNAHRKLAFAHPPEESHHPSDEPPSSPPVPAAIEPDLLGTIPLPPPSEPPPPSHPLPQRSAIHHATQVGFSTSTKALIFLIVLLLLGGAVFLYLWRTRSPLLASFFTNAEASQAQSATPAAAPASMPPGKPADQEGATKGAVTPALPLPDVPAIQARVEKMKTAVDASREDLAAASGDGAAAPGVVPPAVQPQAVKAPVPKPAASPPVAKVTPPPAAPAPQPNVDWPAIRIGGVMPHVGGGQQTAIINDSLIGVGESVDGLTLVEVKDKGVVLEYRGATRYFPIGATRR